MPTSSFHFIYLRPEIRDTRWSHLHHLLHQGCWKHDQQNVMVCTDLDISHHIFLSARAKDWTATGCKNLSLRYEFVDSILEVASHKTQFGFVNLMELHEESAEAEAE